MKQAIHAVALVLAGAIGMLGLIVLLESAEAIPSDYSPYRKLNVFAKVLTYVENNYVDHVDDARLIHGAIDGMLSTLDPHSTYMTAEQYRQLRADTQGEFGGLGIEVEVRGEWLVIVAPLEDTPAFKAGLRAGDTITAIDGESTREMAMDQAVRRMRGPRGTAVRLGIRREGIPQLLSFEIVRDVIHITSVSSRRLPGDLGYVRIKTFQERTDLQVSAAIEALQGQAALRGLILDLRNNPGGLLDQAVRVADLFLDQGLIVRTTGQGGKTMDVERAHLRGTYRDVPVVVLINKGSASAAEIVAGALQDHKRAYLIGTRSFGKGSVQTIIELEDDSALKLTVARYYTPSGRSIHQQGIQPDRVVADPPNGGAIFGTWVSSDDGPLREAVAYLKARPAGKRSRG